ncbi:MAG: hypothetical protein A3B94_01110, partial [Candidatus Jacksonbacteria bacterium RIFCSPHIGHO2_02_FULL_43_10]
ETTDTKKSTAPIIAIIVVILIIVVGYLLLKNKAQQNTKQIPPSNQNEQSTPDTDSLSDVPVPPSDAPAPTDTLPLPNTDDSLSTTDTIVTQAETKTFTINASNFTFSLSEIKVKQGDTVKIVFQNNDGVHDWVIDEFNARTKQIKADATDTVEFIADKAGTFEYYCSVGKHRELGMKGTLIVE